jgi:hypothetical protein
MVNLPLLLLQHLSTGAGDVASDNKGRTAVSDEAKYLR